MLQFYYTTTNTIFPGISLSIQSFKNLFSLSVKFGYLIEDFSTGLYGSLLATLFAPSVNNGTVASALFVVNGGTKVPLVATGTGVLSYNTRELFPV